jgi:hypothetical protein
MSAFTRDVAQLTYFSIVMAGASAIGYFVILVLTAALANV